MRSLTLQIKYCEWFLEILDAPPNWALRLVPNFCLKGDGSMSKKSEKTMLESLGKSIQDRVSSTNFDSFENLYLVRSLKKRFSKTFETLLVSLSNLRWDINRTLISPVRKYFSRSAYGDHTRQLLWRLDFSGTSCPNAIPPPLPDSLRSFHDSDTEKRRRNSRCSLASMS